MLPPTSWIVTEASAGLRNQAAGLAVAAGLAPETRDIGAVGLWRHVSPALWPSPLTAIGPRPGAFDGTLPELLIGCGGKSAAVLAALRKRARTVIVQHPRIDPRRFDLVVAATHDRLEGPNVVVTRTALHRVTRERLRHEAEVWAPHFAHLPRPLVAVLVGGTNGRFRLDARVGTDLAARLAAMLREDKVGLMVTPSRRTAEDVRHAMARVLAPEGAWIWDGAGENPYFGMLALADAIVVTQDSVSMISEAASTRVPVMVAALPGRSRRIGLFLHVLEQEGRIRRFQGRLEEWPVTPIDDTPMAAEELRRRLGF